MLPSRKTGKKISGRKPLARIVLHGHQEADNFALLHAKAEGNLLTRKLTMLPPNELTPGMYRKHLKKLSISEGWKYQEFDVKTLRKMGAGAFVAVAQGDPKMPPLCICNGASSMRPKPWRWWVKVSVLIPEAII